MNEQQVRQMVRDEIIKILGNSSTIPFEVDGAIRDRFGFADLTPLESSAKAASSENQAVDEAGAASYNVLKTPDGFRQVTTGGTTLYFAYWT